jgi:histidyl-tRNA synthetase
VGDELAEGNVQLKDLEAGTQRLVPLVDLAHELARAAKSHHHG